MEIAPAATPVASDAPARPSEVHWTTRLVAEGVGSAWALATVAPGAAAVASAIDVDDRPSTPAPAPLPEPTGPAAAASDAGRRSGSRRIIMRWYWPPASVTVLPPRTNPGARSSMSTCPSLTATGLDNGSRPASRPLT